MGAVCDLQGEAAAVRVRAMLKISERGMYAEGIIFVVPN